MNGIDVSSWQPRNITTLVPYDFAIIKATEGTSYVSPACEQQYQLAKQRGKFLGVYHFASGLDPAAEADHFINSVQGYVGEAILVLDYEAGALVRGREWVRSFIRHVVARTKVRPLIYASLSVVQSQQLDKLAAEENCALWAAAYPNNNPTGYYAADQLAGSVIRQYSSRGRLLGYSGNLDLNYSTLTSAQWKKYATGVRGSADEPEGNPLRKSKDEIATEVMRGAWGNGDDRKARLTAAGYDYSAIQKIINSRYVRRSDEEVAREVLAGKWGNGDDRKSRLKSQGYDYDKIQAIVNKTLKAEPATKATYIVVPSGSNLSTIARQYGTTVAQLLVWNRTNYPLMTANYIRAGWRLRVK